MVNFDQTAINTTYRSNNYNERNEEIAHIVLHYTDMNSAKEALLRLCDPEAQVSSHYLIDTQGVIYNLVADEKRAWHAGGNDKSSWGGKPDLNNSGIGIELDNPGHLNGYKPFTNEQYQSLIALCHYLIKKYNIKAKNIVGHSDVAASRKKDPGELFNWRLLGEHNIGIYHQLQPPINNIILAKFGDCNIKAWQQKLQALGYSITVNDVFDQQTLDVVIAFRRRFVQNDLANYWDMYCQAILDYLYLEL
jgi:N-acetylmuramoyl-L-alanine amidase